MFSIQQFLCGWYIYLVILCGLAAASAGTRSWQGRLALIGAVDAFVLLISLYGFVPLPFGVTGSLVLKVYLLLVGGLLTFAAPRQDTRLIAILLAAAAAAPVYLHFYSG